MYLSASPEFGLRSFLSSGSRGWPPPVQKVPAMAPSFDDVSFRAYLNFQKHGSDDGHDLNDWFAAEAELIAEQNHAARI